MKKVILLFCVSLICSSLFSQNIHDYWFDANESAIVIPTNQERKIIPNQYRTLALDLEGLKNVLAAAPQEFTTAAKQNPLLVALPLPGGENAIFKVWESAVMSPILAAKYPNIKSFAGVGADDRSLHVRFEYAKKGFRAMIGTNDGVVFIDPYLDGNNTNYLSYFKKDRPPNAEEMAMIQGSHHFQADPTEHLKYLKPIKGGKNSPFKSPTNAPTSNGDPVELRVYKLALATTGEFASTQGGSLNAVMAEMVYASSRLNFIFEKETGVRFQLVDNNDEILFLDGENDPYTGPDVGVYFGENTLTLNTFIGVDNYDIGHLFATPPCTSFGNNVGGASGGTGIVCSNGKARGVSCNSNPSDNFYLGTLSHEVGHQLDAAHPWNNCTDFLNGTDPDNPNPNPQISIGNAYEPGSGSTIMSYAGACGANNIQFGSDDYLHVNSIEAIQKFSREGAGTCADVLPTTNIEPEVSIAIGHGLKIPISTPFQLTGYATDANAEDTLTYCWEQYNLGPISPLGSPIGNAPSFRTYPPTENPTRVFPRIQSIVSNINTAVEVLPTYSRDLTFRCVVRDSKWGGGGAIWEEISFDAVETAGPFLVNYPNTVQEMKVGDYVEILWNVANTDVAPVNCQFVNILLSVNGGYEYPYTLATNVPNTGSYTVVIPDAITNIARVKVEAADNIFFDISNSNSKIVAPTEAGFSVAAGPFFQKVCLPDLPVYEINTLSLLGFDSLVNFEVIGLPAGATAEFSANPVMASENATLTINTDNNPMADGNFQFQLMAFVPGVDTIYQDLSYETGATDFSDFALTSPSNGSTGAEEVPSFTWVEGNAADNYVIEISNNPTFDPASIMDTEVVSGNNYTTDVQLDLGEIYFWRIRPQNECAAGEWSEITAFAIKSLSCESRTSDHNPITISSQGLPVIESVINFPAEGNIFDLNVKNIQGNHNAFKDLAMTLIGPDETEVELFNSVFCQANIMNFGLDDEAAFIIGTDCPVDNEISYKPANPLEIFDDKNAQGDWTLRVAVINTDGTGGKLEEWTLQICSAANLSPPSLIKNETMPLPPAATRSIDDEFLLTEDPNNIPEELIYTIITLPENGQLFFLTDELGIGDKFSQKSSSAGNVTYVHDGSSTVDDSFNFTVTDGEGGLIATPQFNIVIDPDVVLNTKDILEENEISIFPNPANEMINIGFKKPINEQINIRIYNIQGQLLTEKAVNNSQELIQMQTSNFADGIYLVQVRTKGQSMTERVTIQR